MLDIACLIYDLLRFSSPCLLTKMDSWELLFTMGLKILTNLRNTFLFSSKPSVLRVYRSLPPAMKGSSTE